MILQRVLDTAAKSAAALVGDGAVLRVADAAGVLTDTTVYHPDAAKAAAIRAIVELPDQRAQDGTSGAVARTGRVLVDNAVTLDKLQAAIPRRLHEFLARLDVRALIMVPLIVDGRYVGFLALIRHHGTYGSADERLIADIAARVALAVGTAQIVGRLRAEQDNYRQIVQTSLEGVWKTDTAGVTTFVNARMAEILGTTPEQMIGHPAARWSTEAATAESLRRVADRLAGALGEVRDPATPARRPVGVGARVSRAGAG
jgi:PAS domain-containing protein